MYFALMGKLSARRQNLTEDKDKGFTLIELLVVVIIIGILAAIAIPVYLGVQNNAKDSGVKSDLSNAKTAVIAYQTESGSFPTTADLTVDKLGSYGYTVGANTVGLGYSGSSTASKFCLTAKKASDATKSFYVTESSGVVEAKPTGSVC
jgi:prepilin-type N-terminal cleavage/methylation domain-containing protein